MSIDTTSKASNIFSYCIYNIKRKLWRVTPQRNRSVFGFVTEFIMLVYAATLKYTEEMDLIK